MGNKFLIIGQLPPPHHGSNVMAKMFVNSLIKLGSDIEIVEKTFSKKLEDIEKISIKKIFKIPLITSSLIYYLTKKKYDICFYFMSIKPPSILFDAFLLSIIRIFRINCVLYLHGKGIINLDERIIWPLLSFVKKSISKSLGAIVLGESLKCDVKHLIPVNKIFVLPNAIPDIKLKVIENNFYRDNKIKVLFLSNIMPSKGPLEFLKMAIKINRKDKNIKFFLAGPIRSARFLSEIKKIIYSGALNDCLVLPGAVYGAEKEKLFDDCDIFVYPTLNDAFPLVSLEAMRAGLPIVSSDDGSIPEIVIDGVNGFIVKPKDIDMLTERVFRLINDPELRIKMGSAGREIFEKNFTIDSYQNRLEKGLVFFTNLIEESNRRKILGCRKNIDPQKSECGSHPDNC